MKALLTSVTSLCLLSLTHIATAFDKQSPTPHDFSPYADVTINTHWDSRYQDMETDRFGASQPKQRR